MNDTWKKLDLEGAGLQRLNMTLAREMKRRPVAYALLALFPVGAHRFYLEEHIGGLAYLGLTGLALLLAFVFGLAWALIGLVPAALLAVIDLVWIDRRITAYNKALRMRHFLKPGGQPPRNYRGRYTEDDADLDDYLRLKESERAGHQPVGGDASPARTRSTPSFNEQEAMLRELTQRKRT